ncbi:MAG TPA: AAA family ATPase [Gemmatimonadaceae bacterium]|nr:AAA family ATPase [Gemmatimonadaceae bacterium]
MLDSSRRPGRRDVEAPLLLLRAAAMVTRPDSLPAGGVLAVRDAALPPAQLDAALESLGLPAASWVPDLGSLVRAMATAAPSLVLAPAPDSGRGVEAFDAFADALQRLPRTRAIAFASTKDADAVLAAMRAGVHEFLVLPADEDALRRAIGRVQQAGAVDTSLGTVYSVYSAKGGLGCSTLSLSLAWALAHRRPGARVALVDFTTTGAGVRVMLDLAPVYDLGSIASRTTALDRDFVRSCMVSHPAGVDVLVAAEELDATDPLDAATASRVLDILRQQFDHVVVDVDHHFAEQTIAALDLADRILLVTQLDISALRSAQRTLGVFTRLGYAREKVALVANRRTDRDRIALEDAERVLGRSIDVSVPNDYASCADAITFGRFVQAHAPTSPLVDGVAAMVATLTGEAPPPAVTAHAGGSRLARLFARR